MKTSAHLTQAHIQFKESDDTTCRFVQVARCTNVYTFESCPFRLSALRGEASELGFFSSLKISGI